MTADTTLDHLAAEWRASDDPAKLIAAAEQIPPGTAAANIETLLGPPVNRSTLTDGGQVWTYVRSDAGRGQFQSLSVLISPTGGFIRLGRKSID